MARIRTSLESALLARSKDTENSAPLSTLKLQGPQIAITVAKKVGLG